MLHDLLRANERRVTIDEIQKRVAEHFNIKMAEMTSSRRARAVARPRQVAMYLAKQLTSRSLPEIGRKFGGRDHTTVMHAVKKIEELIASDPSARRGRRAAPPHAAKLTRVIASASAIAGAELLASMPRRRNGAVRRRFRAIMRSRLRRLAQHCPRAADGDLRPIL